MANIVATNALGHGLVLKDGQFDMPGLKGVPHAGLLPVPTPIPVLRIKFDDSTYRVSSTFDLMATPREPDIMIKSLTIMTASGTVVLRVDDWNVRLEPKKIDSPFLEITRKSDTISGNNYADVIELGSGNDLGLGNGGADLIWGQYGADCLMGGQGADTLTGGTGADFLYGGKNDTRDAFVFGNYDSGKDIARDMIFDFDSGEDKISLAAMDANTRREGDQAFIFAGKRSDTYGRANAVWYVDKGDDLIVRGDTNGDKVFDFEIELKSIDQVVKADFIL